jgi:phosphoribosylformylglycinamidine cyclo-ligase
MPATYKQAGVDIEAGDRVVEAARRAAAATRRPEVVGGIGGFGALMRLPKRYRKPLLVTSTDGVGTKLRVALMAGRHGTIGIDLVAMCVNDILTLGAEPLAFLDYYVTDRVQPKVAAKVLDGIGEGCRLAGCSLIGGETAEHPGCFTPGEYDLAGFALGVVDEDRVVDGSTIAPGDVVIALPSSGLHSNGYSLVRHLCFTTAKLGLDARPRELRGTLGSELLKPTRIYTKAVLALPRGAVKGMAHITGGGITGNLVRVLPDDCRAVLRNGSWKVPGIFALLQRLGDVADDEMHRTFNMGIGYTLVVSPRRLAGVLKILAENGEKPVVIGAIERRANPAQAGVSIS